MRSPDVYITTVRGSQWVRRDGDQDWVRRDWVRAAARAARIAGISRPAEAPPAFCLIHLVVVVVGRGQGDVAATVEAATQGLVEARVIEASTSTYVDGPHITYRAAPGATSPALELQITPVVQQLDLFA